MKFNEFKRKLESKVNPYRYIYEHDTKSRLYYFTLYRPNLTHIFFSISESTIKNNEKLATQILLKVKERY